MVLTAVTMTGGSSERFNFLLPHPHHDLNFDFGTLFPRAKRLRRAYVKLFCDKGRFTVLIEL